MRRPSHNRARRSLGTHYDSKHRTIRNHRWLLLLLAVFLLPCSYAAPASPEAKYHKAIQLARDGRHDQALILLRELTGDYPGKREYLYDYLTVLGWAERYGEELAQARRLRLPDAPVYVLESLGHAARNLGDAAQAVTYYRMAVDREPDRADSVMGLAGSLSDQGKTNEAIELLHAFVQRHPDNPEAMASLASAYQNSNQLYQALSAYDRLLAVKPGDREALRQRIFLTARLGAAPLALDMAQSQPGLLSDDELDSLTLDAASKYIRWNGLYHPLPAQGFDDTDHAITLLQDVLTRLEKRGEGSAPLANRARFDLIVALGGRNRPQHAVDLYESLRAQGTEIPDYVTQAAADAYAALHNPERARAMYTELLQAHPDDFQLRMALFYSAFDLNEAEQGLELIDALAAEQTDPDLRLRTERSAAMARAWSDNLAAAQARYEALTHAAPNNPQLHAELAYVYLWRGWPRRALDEFRISQAIEPETLSARLGEIEAYRDRNDFSAAGREIDGLLERYADDVEAGKLRGSWDIHNMRELWVQASGTYSNGPQIGSRDLDVDTYLYSQPLRIRYRVFGHGYYSQSTFPEGKGIYRRLGAGLEYRARDLELSGELSDGAARDKGLGVALRGLWMFDDHWRFSGRYDSYSNEVPLRGRLDEDIDGWSLGGDVEYRVNESRGFGAGLQRLGFSDGNRRTLANASAYQRLINRPRYKLNGRLGLYSSHNTRDAAPYYNPRSDLTLEASAVNEWLLFRRYSRAFLQRLGLSLGLYQERGYADKPVGGVFYEHEWRWYERLNLIYGLALNRPAYDGAYETHTRLYLNLRWRF